MDFGCHTKLQEKTTKYAPLVAALLKLWRKVEFVAITVGHASTTLTGNQWSLTQALSATRPEISRARARRNVSSPDTDIAARTHESSLFKFLTQTLPKLAQTRLLGIIYNRQALVHA